MRDTLNLLVPISVVVSMIAWIKAMAIWRALHSVVALTWATPIGDCWRLYERFWWVSNVWDDVGCRLPKHNHAQTPNKIIG